ncbi:hypothetical protein [Amycolatopsis sp. VC5-11]|uniref:hypothetical protein n=1 Tax=Amycolatopsis sp. VC5-11 TaxID=3120156 RepID=UPI00300888B7
MTGDLNRTVVQPAAKRATSGRRRWIVAVGVLFVISLAGIGLVLFSQHSQIAQLETSGTARDTTNRELARDVAALADQVKRLGGTPVVQPPAAPAAAQADPTQLRATARQAVEDYCATRNQCRGANGASPDFDALTNAVLARIPVPKDGTDGHDGRDAPVPDYPALVASAVASYCDAHDQCRGEPGTNGKNGNDGAPGPACPSGFELRDAVITAPDGTTYQGKACVDPASGSAPPSTDPPTTGG